MNTNIKTTNISLTDAISEYVSKRMEKIEKLVGDDTSIQCDIELARTTAHHNKGDIFKAEAHIVGAGLNIFHACEKEDLYAAIDEMRDAVLRELKSHRQKNMSSIRRGGAAVKDMMRGLWPWK
ncbi:MAG: ribosome-associated translation inhibitor RaiA [Patescibacteria group bacterium]